MRKVNHILVGTIVGATANRQNESCSCIPTRYVLAIMMFFGTFHVYFLRVNLSAAIVAMVDYEGLQTLAGNDTSNSTSKMSSAIANLSEYEVVKSTDEEKRSCGNVISSNKSDESSGSRIGEGKFLWDANMQGLALGCYFYGYMCSQIIGAWLGRKLGLIRLWGGCVVTASLLTMFLPAAAEVGFGAFVAIRILIGLVSGVSYPIMHGLWSMWAPPSERGKLLVIQFAGSPMGAAIAFPLCGYLSAEYGWQSAFYVSAMSSLIWAVLLLILIHDSPAEHPRISTTERQFIEDSLQQNLPSSDARQQLKMPVPWFSLLSSIRMWSTVIPQFSTNFGTYIFLTMLPTYLRTVMNLDLKFSGMLSSIPHISKLCMFPISGVVADFVVSKGVPTIYVRKSWTAIATFMPGIALLVAANTGCNLALLIFLFAIPDATDTFSIPGFKASMIEMAPAFAGIIFAFGNTAASASGFIAPQIAGSLREAYIHDPARGWSIIFAMGAAIYFVAGLVFIVFGTSDVQSWAKPEQNIVRESAEEPGAEMKILRAPDEQLSSS